MTEQLLKSSLVAVPLVNTRLVVVKIPALRFDGVHHIGHMRGHTDQQACVTNSLQAVLDDVESPLLEKPVGYFAVMGDGD